jgi:hypothetical protein
MAAAMPLLLAGVQHAITPAKRKLGSVVLLTRSSERVRGLPRSVLDALFRAFQLAQLPLPEHQALGETSSSAANSFALNPLSFPRFPRSTRFAQISRDARAIRCLFRCTPTYEPIAATSSTCSTGRVLHV